MLAPGFIARSRAAVRTEKAMKKFLIIGIPIVVLLAIGFGAAAWMRSGATQGADATPVRVEPVIAGNLIELVQAPGEIQPRTKVSISARVVARIKELPFIEGSKVKTGDVIVRLDSTDLEAALRSTEARYAAQKAQIDVEESRANAQKAQLDAAQATLFDAERDLARQKALLATGDVSQTTLDQADRHFAEQKAMTAAAAQTLASIQRNLIVVKHNLEAAEAEVTQARANLSYATIASPLDGIITRLNGKVGELVVTGTMNNAGTVIMEVADFSEILMVARVDEANIASVKPGQKARLHIQAYDTRIFDGVVETVGVAQAQTANAAQGASSGTGRYFKVEIVVNTGGERLFSGLSADADIESQRHNGVMKIPSQAVVGRPTEELPPEIRDRNPLVDRANSMTAVVYRFVDGKAMVTPVKTGAADLTHVIITEGLTGTDKVITGPYKALEKLSNSQVVKDDSATTQPTTQPTGKSATTAKADARSL